jgi:3-polyprenyl-4-hydroxybenzoate decarboxylase
MDYDKIPFSNRDIDRITKVSSKATSTGSLNNQKSKGSFKVQKRSVTYNDSTPVEASITKGSINNGNSTGKTKIINAETNTVSKIRNGRSTQRSITPKAAARKIKRIENKL